MTEEVYYELKQRYGAKVRLYFNQLNEIDPTTGRTTTYKSVLQFDAVVTPTTVFRKFPRVPELQAKINKSLLEVLILKKREIKIPDYIIYKQQRYDILKFEDFEKVISLTIAKSDNSLPKEIFVENISQSLNFNNAFESEVV